MEKMARTSETDPYFQPTKRGPLRDISGNLPVDGTSEIRFKKPFRSRVAALIETHPPAPTTTKDCGIKISGNPKTNSIAYCSDLSVVILDLDSPFNAFVYKGHTVATKVARFSPDGDSVASADISGVIQIWKPDGDPGAIKKFSSGRIDDLQWSPNGKSLLVCEFSLGKLYVRTFHCDSAGSDLEEFGGHSLPVLSCAFNPKPPYQIVTGGSDFLVNVYQGPPYELFLTNSEHSSSVHCISYSPSGDKFISVSSDKKGIIYDGSTGVKLGELLSEDVDTGQFFSVSWSSDNRHVLTASEHSANIWEIADGNRGILKGTLGCPGSDGMGVLVGCIWLNDNLLVVSLGGMINIFSARDFDKPTVSIFGHETCVNFVSCLDQSSPKVILSGSRDGTILRWIPHVGYGGELKRTEKTPMKCFAAVGKTILISGNHNKVTIIFLNEDTDCREEKVIVVRSPPVDLSIAQSCNLSLIATISSVIIVKDAVVVSCTDLQYSVTASTIAPHGRDIIVGDKNGKLYIYSVNSDYTLCLKDVLHRHSGSITVVKYSPDGYFFASTDTLHESVVWVCASHQMKLKDLFHHRASVTSVAWSPNSRRVATGSLDCDVMVYDVEQHPSTRVIISRAHRSFVYGLVFTDDNTLVSCGGDGCVCLWKMPN